MNSVYFSTKKTGQRGFTITELMIAMTLGLILLTGMISAFVGSKRSSEFNSAISNMQESARFAMDTISRFTRIAGFQGCIDLNKSSAIIRGDNSPTTNLIDTAVSSSAVVSPGSWVPAPPLSFLYPQNGVEAVPGTHTLALQFGSAVVSRLSVAMLNEASAIPLLHNRAGLRDGDLAIISDCDVADLFRVTTAPTEDGPLTHLAVDNDNNGNLSKAYGRPSSIRDTRVMKFNSNVYFVGTTGELTESGDPLRSLYVQTLPYEASNPPTQLVEGIENLRVRFGVRQNNGALVYVTSSQPGYDPSRIETVQLGILMASYERIRNDADQQTYLLAGQPIPPAAAGQTVMDGLNHSSNTQYRLVFNTTIKVRNRRDREI